ncbi:MAG: mycothiol transferase [Propionibacteriaceae bacterium]
MTASSDLLNDAFGRIHDVVHGVLDGLTPEQLNARVDPEANSIGWLVWHLTRVQDDHVAGVAETEQRWTAGGWSERFGLPYEDGAIGYGHSSDEVGAFEVSDPDLLGAYLTDVTESTRAYLGELSEDGLGRVVDANWDPPVTLAVRLVSVVSDDLQHAGQAAYLRGLLERS